MTIHPQLRRSMERAVPLVRLNGDTLPGRRAEFAEQLQTIRREETPSVVTEDLLIEGADAQAMAVRIYRNLEGSSPSHPGVVWFHGGGFVLGNLDSEDETCRLVSERLGAVVVSIDYRLAPEDPFPAGVEDCYRGLCWTVEHADTLGIDADRLAIGGNSAGGGLTAAVALMARDRSGPALAYQFLGIPMLDDRCDTESARRNVDERVWNTDLCRDCWELYLGPDRETPSPYAAPARATDLSRLPAAYVLVNQLDPLADEALDYAKRLAHAGVLTEVHFVPGAWHGFTAYLTRIPLTKRTNERWLEAMAEALAVAR